MITLPQIVANTNPTLASPDVRGAFGIMIANMTAKNMSGEVTVKMSSQGTSAGGGSMGVNGIALSLSIPVTKATSGAANTLANA